MMRLCIKAKAHEQDEGFSRHSYEMMAAPRQGSRSVVWRGVGRGGCVHFTLAAVKAKTCGSNSKNDPDSPIDSTAASEYI